MTLLDEAQHAAEAAGGIAYDEACKWVALFGGVLIKALYVSIYDGTGSHLYVCPVCKKEWVGKLANPFMECIFLTHEVGCIYGEAIAHYARVSTKPDFIAEVKGARLSLRK